MFVLAWAMILIYFVSSIGGIYGAKLGVDHYEREKVERRSSMMALLPMLLAEKDRA